MDIAYKIAGLVSFLVLIVGLTISNIHKDKRDMFPIRLYLILATIVYVVNIFDFLVRNAITEKLNQIVLNIFSIFEISLIYTFLFARIKRIRFRNLMVAFYFTYILICLTVWTTSKIAIFSFLPGLFGFEDLFITIPCLFYIYEILKSDLSFDLKSDPNFIVTCGILFYYSVTAPCYFGWLTLYYLSPGFDKIIILLDNIFFIMLNFSFMKAYLCRIPKHQQ
jgi:hypothetical protein